MSADQYFEIRFLDENIVDILAIYTRNTELQNNVYQSSLLLCKENHFIL